MKSRSTRVIKRKMGVGKIRRNRSRRREGKAEGRRNRRGREEERIKVEEKKVVLGGKVSGGGGQ